MTQLSPQWAKGRVEEQVVMKKDSVSVEVLEGKASVEAPGHQRGTRLSRHESGCTAADVCIRNGQNDTRNRRHDLDTNGLPVHNKNAFSGQMGKFSVKAPGERLKPGGSDEVRGTREDWRRGTCYHHVRVN